MDLTPEMTLYSAASQCVLQHTVELQNTDRRAAILPMPVPTSSFLKQTAKQTNKHV
jgi:hypothetical protein